MFDGLSTEVTLLNQFKDADSTGVGMLYLVVICRTLLIDALFLFKVLKIVFKLNTSLLSPNSFFNSDNKLDLMMHPPLQLSRTSKIDMLCFSSLLNFDINSKP